MVWRGKNAWYPDHDEAEHGKAADLVVYKIMIRFARKGYGVFHAGGEG